MIRKILCFLGFHSMWFRDKWLPSIGAEIVTDVIFEGGCIYCDKKNHYKHLVWNGEDMVENDNG